MIDLKYIESRIHDAKEEAEKDLLRRCMEVFIINNQPEKLQFFLSAYPHVDLDGIRGSIGGSPLLQALRYDLLSKGEKGCKCFETLLCHGANPQLPSGWKWDSPETIVDYLESIVAQLKKKKLSQKFAAKIGGDKPERRETVKKAIIHVQALLAIRYPKLKIKGIKPLVQRKFTALSVEYLSDYRRDRKRPVVKAPYKTTIIKFPLN